MFTTNYINIFNTNQSLLNKEYYSILILVFISIFLSLILLSLSYFLSVQNPDSEKLSSYECGFEPYEDARHKFDIKFYIIAILFIVFDLEAIFLFPWSISLSNLDVIGFWSMIDFIFELGVGFFYVWFTNVLDWE
uniref:NADH-ubiquinone oxidoreductase chain 3 n=1 Tax=Coscinodiscus wailesii TaxID=671091 RepID=A0A7T8G4P8_9STRA|nr:NADH dehydrogenase subunit 3 [Coscinodiscus wailesii]QQP21833.1 NADH dehydrogenase subunit 3 [Coscinodiscus wailesii]